MIPEFHYAVAWRASGVHPGAHHGGQRGSGYEFIGHDSFLSNPDPRHLDLRASLHDPFGQLRVRGYRQRSAIPVFVVADLSASLGFRGCVDKLETLARFTTAAAYSVYRNGDLFGFVAADEALRADLFLPLGFHKGAASDLYERLCGFSPSGRSAEALHQTAHHLGRRRALVFLVSDFHFPLDSLVRLLGSLVPHDVVPVVLWDSAEYRYLPSFGLVQVEDPETGNRRRLLMRPGLRERFRLNFEQRRSELTQLCRRWGREPFFIIDRFDPDELTRYFHAGARIPDAGTQPVPPIQAVRGQNREKL